MRSPPPSGGAKTARAPVASAWPARASPLLDPWRRGETRPDRGETRDTHTQMRSRDRAAVSEDLPGLGRPVRAGPVVAGAGTRNRKPPGEVCGGVVLATVLVFSSQQAIEERRIQNRKAAPHLLMRESDREIPTGR